MSIGRMRCTGARSRAILRADGGVQSAGQKETGQDFQDSFRQDCLHVLHFGFPAGGRGSVEAGMLGNDALSERLYVLFLYKTD